MAKAKNFESIKTNNVFEAVEKSAGKKIQQTASEKEIEERKATGKTQGRKGCKATRINIAFTSPNHDYIKTVSKIKGMSLTEYTNYIIEQHRLEHDELYKKAKELLKAANQL